MTLTPRERTCALCRDGDHLLTIEMEDPVTKKRYWSFPGGAVEPGETAEHCAVRETLEETGYSVRLTSDAFTNQYQFHWGGRIFICTTHWFTAELTAEKPAPVVGEDNILQASWLTWPRCRPLFLFNPGIIEALDHFLPLDGTSFKKAQSVQR